MDTLCAAFRTSANGWKGLIDAQELIKHIDESPLISPRPVPKLDPLGEESPSGRVK